MKCERVSEAEIALGQLTLRALGSSQRIEGQTTAGVATVGTASLHEVQGPDGLALTIRDSRWDNGERDVVACARHASPERFATLVERLRLAVLSSRRYYVDLRQARLRPNGHAGLFNADLPELDLASGVEVARTLRSAGATAVGTREALLGDAGRTRGRYTATFDDAECPVPLVAYVLTRVAPVAAAVPA